MRQHNWDDILPATAPIFSEDRPARAERPPRALTEQVMDQIEHPDNLARFTNPAYRLATLILIRAGLRISDALRVSRDCLVLDQEGAPYLRYVNHEMRRQALVPIDEHWRVPTLRAPQSHAESGLGLSVPVRWHQKLATVDIRGARSAYSRCVIRNMLASTS